MNTHTHTHTHVLLVILSALHFPPFRRYLHQILWVHTRSHMNTHCAIHNIDLKCNRFGVSVWAHKYETTTTEINIHGHARTPEMWRVLWLQSVHILSIICLLDYVDRVWHSPFTLMPPHTHHQPKMNNNMSAIICRCLRIGGVCKLRDV